MGGRLQAGAGADLSIRIRLFAVAAGIVAVSLVMSGVLTWVLVRQLEEQNTKDSLEGIALSYTFQVNQLARTTRSPIELADLLTNNASPSTPDRDRLIVLERQSTRVLYDSGSQLAYGTPLSLNVPQKQLSAGNLSIADIEYVYGFARVAPGGYSVVVMRPQSEVAAQASRHLLPNLVLAGGISLGIAFLLALLVTPAMTRPLTELAAASEDVARGNYARRVKFSGSDEIGVVGQAFNRMADAVERARQAQREFLANVSHELKTPLTSLIGFSQALVEGKLTPAEQQRAATILHEESERMLRMSQELLDLARVEAGQMPMTLQPVDLLAMLRQELDLTRARAETRQLGFDLRAGGAVPPVLADPERLHQVLDNLLDNAIKYAPSGSSVEVAVVDADADRLELQVANPVGSHRPDPQRIFERFYRGDPSRSAAGGVGLGLAISREIAVQMGGRLWCEFDPDGRLRMRFEMWTQAGAGQAGRPAPASSPRLGQGVAPGQAFSGPELPPARP